MSSLVLQLLGGCLDDCSTGAPALDGVCVNDADAEVDTAETGDTGDSGVGEWTVCAAGGAPYDSIQDAIDAAVSGDEITVCPGSYPGFDVSAKDLIVRGAGPGESVVDGGAETAISVVGSNFRLRGFSIRSRSTDTKKAACVHVESSTGTVEEVTLFGSLTPGSLAHQEESSVRWLDIVAEDNEAGKVLSGQRGTLTLRHSVFRRNTGYYGDGGTLLELLGSDYEIANNILHNNETSATASAGHFGAPAEGFGWVYNNVWWGNDHHGAAYLLASEGDVRLVNNVVNATVGGGILASTANSDGLLYNSSYGNSGEDWVTERDGEIPATNLSEDCWLVSPLSGDFSLNEGYSPCVDAGHPDYGYNDQADATRSDIGAFGGPLGVWSPR